MKLGPVIRIALRYGVGYLAGSEVGAALAADPEVVLVLSVVAGACIEVAYTFAVKKGWAT